MIKKYIRIIYVGLAITGITTSCDVMDTKPFESYNEENVWESEETIEAFIMKSYNGTITHFTGNSASWEALTPNGCRCDQYDNSIDNTATETGIDSYSDYDFGRFGEQRKCNMIIEKVAQSELPEKVKKEFIAEGYFLRGALYFDMTRKMGRFVPITRVLSLDDNEAFQTPLTGSIEESYQFVLDDLNKAVEGLPETSEHGRANKYVALALRSRAALQAYAYTKDEKFLDIVISSANEIIESGKYRLTDNYGGLFNNESPEDAEIIMARYYLEQDASVVDFNELVRVMPNLPVDDIIKGSKDGINTLNPEVQTFDSWGRYWPTQDLVDQYLVKDEKTGEAKVWYESSQIKDNIDFLNTDRLERGAIETFTRFDGEKRYIPTSLDLTTGRDDYPLITHNLHIKDGCTRDITDLMYMNRDKRMDATIVRDKTTLLGEYLEMNMGGNASQGVRANENGAWYTTATGYYWRKYIVPHDPLLEKVNFHYVIARLGEMYMNLAEAYLLKGDVPAAVKALNETRVMHGGLSASTAATTEEAWKDYIRERRVEMAYEEADIYYSYLRWGKYGSYSNYGREPGDVIKDLNAPIYKISITSDRKAACINQLTLLNSWNRKFTTKRYLFPIPQGDIDTRAASGIIDKQNEGW